MLFGIDPIDLIKTVGVLGMAFIVFAESGLLVGFLLPGDTLLFAAGFLATQNVLGVSVHVLAAVLFLAAIAGDSVGYAIGHRTGSRIFRKEDSIIFHKDNIKRAEAFYKRFGSITIVIARFVPVVRTFAPVVAGIGNMNYRTFLIYNMIGGLLWAVGITYLGYFSGGFFESHGIDIDHFILPAIGIATLISIISPLIHILKNPKNRAKLRAKFKKNS